MFLRMPVRSRRRLLSCGTDEPSDPGWRLWLASEGERSIHPAYVRRMSLVALTATLNSIGPLPSTLTATGTPMPSPLVGSAEVASMVAGATIGTIAGLPSGIAMSITCASMFIAGHPTNHRIEKFSFADTIFIGIAPGVVAGDKEHRPGPCPRPGMRPRAPGLARRSVDNALLRPPARPQPHRARGRRAGRRSTRGARRRPRAQWQT